MRRIPGLDVATDLSRIDVASNDVTVDRGGLEKLQLAHLTSVPFEDLDVFARRRLEWSAESSVPKIIERGRGGWCCELNGASPPRWRGSGSR